MSEPLDRIVDESRTRAGSDSCPDGPLIWLVVGDKRGDNSQIRNLARAAGWDWTEKTIRMAPKWVDGKPRVRASLDHVDIARSDALEGPWPDLVITAGRRLSCVALWIKQASGGRTRIVLIGKPRGGAPEFDLVVAASHYVMPEAKNVARHALPLNQVDFDALAEVKKAWVGRLTLLPRPLTALMVGGPTGGLRLDVEVARELLEKSLAVVEAQRGSLYITTSRRTPRAVSDWLREACPATGSIYVYDEESPPEANPYQGLLALADDFVVTTDSLSMMVEVAQLGRPLRLHPLERESGPVERALVSAGLLKGLSARTDPIPGGGLMTRALGALGWPIHSRDLGAIPRRLVQMGLAGWLGDPVVEPVTFEDDALGEVVARLHSLVA